MPNTFGCKIMCKVGHCNGLISKFGVESMLSVLLHAGGFGYGMTRCRLTPTKIFYSQLK